MSPRVPFASPKTQISSEGHGDCPSWAWTRGMRFSFASSN